MMMMMIGFLMGEPGSASSRSTLPPPPDPEEKLLGMVEQFMGRISFLPPNHLEHWGTQSQLLSLTNGLRFLHCTALCCVVWLTAEAGRVRRENERRLRRFTGGRSTCSRRLRRLLRRQRFFTHQRGPCFCLPCLVGRQEEHPACKKWVMRCWRGYLSGARCKWFICV